MLITTGISSFETINQGEFFFFCQTNALKLFLNTLYKTDIHYEKQITTGFPQELSQ